jgi:hypothetical protein
VESAVVDLVMDVRSCCGSSIKLKKITVTLDALLRG